MTDPAQNAALIRQFYDEVFNAGNIELRASKSTGPAIATTTSPCLTALSITTRTWPATLASRPRSLTGGWTSRT